METDELIEKIQKMNAGKLTPEEMEQIVQEQNEKNKKLEEQLLNAKTAVDTEGGVIVAMDSAIQFEIEKSRGKYKISCWKGAEELELIKTFKVSEFPERKWFEDKLKIMQFGRVAGMFGFGGMV